MVAEAAPPPAVAADGPPPEILYRRKLHLLRSVKELWAARELIGTLTERNLRSRYKQTFLGFAWALITPVTLMIVFTVFLRRVARIDTGSTPYPIFSYVGLLPWSFFSNAVSASSLVILSNNSLLNKVYCPREVFPISTITSSAADTACAMVALFMLFIGYRQGPMAASVWVPLLTLVLLVFTLGVCLLLSALTVYLRDLRHGIGIIVQLGLFATPVAYSMANIVPARFQTYYAALNPLGPVIDGYRRTVLFGKSPDLYLLAVAGAAATVWLVVGYVVFKRLETGFSDVA
jgi:ABC-2 type transport system permease protein/lipopolysaccharide transport system permease protein